MVIDLPYPPSVNGYWRTFRNRQIISKAGREYRKTVAAKLAGIKPLLGRLAIEIAVYPPDRRRRDLDNVLKASLDAMAVAGVYGDDSQIDRLTVVRGNVERGGSLVATVTELEGQG